jgi:DNA-binding HxlR family transcriptional regulator
MEGFVKKSISLRGDITCPIAVAAEVLSDQWAVIVLRDIAFFNQRTFGAILDNNNEKISRPTLANRFKASLRYRAAQRAGDAGHAQRKIYSLTEPALGLLPVMVGMAKWSLSQEGFKAQQIEFLNDLYSPASQAMTELIDGLRITHAIDIAVKRHREAFFAIFMANHLIAKTARTSRPDQLSRLAS